MWSPLKGALSACHDPQAHGGGLVLCACANTKLVTAASSWTARRSSVVDDAIKLACTGIAQCAQWAAAWPLVLVPRSRTLHCANLGAVRSLLLFVF